MEKTFEVGQASLRSDVLFGRFVEPGSYHQPHTPPLLVAEGTEALGTAESIASKYRSYAWVVPLERGAVRAWETDGFGGRVARARSQLTSADLAFDLTAPTTELEEAGSTASAAVGIINRTSLRTMASSLSRFRGDVPA